MRATGALRYCLWGSAVALGALGVLLFVFVPRGGAAIRWGLLGWWITALTGVAGGGWMVAVHGRPGPVFIGAVVGSMLARLAAAALGAFAAGTIGTKAAWPYVIGLGAGFVPLQVFEVAWFLRRNKTPPAEG